MSIRLGWSLAVTAFKNWKADFAQSMGAALAYYTVFSIAPLLVITIAVAGLVFGQDVAQAAILEQAEALLGEKAAGTIEGLLQSAQKPKEGIVATVLGIAALIVGATTVFAELESNLNRIWKAEPPKHSGILSFLRTRLLSFGLVLAVGFLLNRFASIDCRPGGPRKILGCVVRANGKQSYRYINLVIPLAAITIMFAMIYKFLPNIRIRWRDVWIGALVTSVLFTLGRFAIGLYLGKAGIESSYGAAGALVLLLVWVYYSAQIFLLGAEFTKVFAQRQGARPERSKPPPSGSKKLASN